MIQLLLNKTTLPFQLLPMPKVDQSLLRIHEAPPLQKAKSQVIPKHRGLTTLFHTPQNAQFIFQLIHPICQYYCAQTNSKGADQTARIG